MTGKTKKMTVEELDKERKRLANALLQIASHFRPVSKAKLGSRKWVMDLFKAIGESHRRILAPDEIEPIQALRSVASIAGVFSSIEKVTSTWLKDLENTLMMIMKENERVDKEHGMLADICDLVFDDENRAAEHGYEGVVEKVKRILLERRVNTDDLADILLRLNRLVSENEHRIRRDIPMNPIEALDYLDKLIGENQELEMMNESHQKGIKLIREALFGAEERDVTWEDAVDEINRLTKANEVLEKTRNDVCKALHGSNIYANLAGEVAALQQEKRRIDDERDKYKMALAEIRRAVMGPDFTGASLERIIDEVKKFMDEFRKANDALFSVSRLVHIDNEMGFASEPDDIVSKTTEVVKEWMNLTQRMAEKNKEIKDLMSFRNAYIDLQWLIPGAVDKIFAWWGRPSGDSERKHLIRIIRESLMLRKEDGDESPVGLVQKKCPRCHGYFATLAPRKDIYCRTCTVSGIETSQNKQRDAIRRVLSCVLQVTTPEKPSLDDLRLLGLV